jgi:magnesium transporter
MAFVSDVYFSEVSGKDVLDQYGSRLGTLWDLAIVPGPIYPGVVKLILRKGKRLLEVPVDHLNLFNRFVITVNLSERKAADYASREGDILIKEHILDKQILDINGAKVVRVNDLKLGEGDGTICVLGIDVGFKGILRRVDGGQMIQKLMELLNRPIKENMIGWDYLQTINPSLTNLTLNVARKQLSEMHPSDLAEILTGIPTEDGTALLSSVDEELAGEALHEVPAEVREKLLKEMDKEVISDILEEMPPDEAADILGDMPEEASQELLSLMETEEAEEVKDLLIYEDDTAGGLMTSEFLDFGPDMTIDETLTAIRLLIPDVEFIYYIFVVDDEDHLLGVLTLKRLLTSPLDTRLRDVMVQNVKSVTLDANRKEIAELFSKYDLAAVPVVDEEDKICGVITVDDVIDLLVPNPTRRRRKRTFR